MALVRCVTEIGMGVDVHGLDYTNAAKRAVFDAIHHSSLGFPRLVGKTADDRTAVRPCDLANGLRAAPLPTR